MLTQLIRFYGGTMQGVFARYLEESFNIFASQQQEANEGLPANPVEAFETMTKQNLEMWSDMQQGFMQASGFTSGKKPGKP